MSSLLIKNLDEGVLRKLQERAVNNGRSIEAEIRVILMDAIERDKEEYGLGTAIRELFAPFGDVVLEIPPRDDMVLENSIFE